MYSSQKNPNFTKTFTEAVKWFVENSKKHLRPLETSKIGACEEHVKHPGWTTERKERARKGPVLNSASHTWRQSELKRKKQLISH